MFLKLLNSDNVPVPTAEKYSSLPQQKSQFLGTLVNRDFRSSGSADHKYLILINPVISSGVLIQKNRKSSQNGALLPT